MERITAHDLQMLAHGLTHQFKRLKWIIRFGKTVIPLLLLM